MKEDHDMSGDSIIVSCRQCGKKNRVPRARVHERAQCGACGSPLQKETDTGRPLTVTDISFEEEVVQSTLPVLVDCWAPWCGPCHVVAPHIDTLATEMHHQARFTKLNVDENPVTAQRFDIRSIPTMLIFNNGLLVDRIIGAVSKDEIRRRMAAVTN